MMKQIKQEQLEYARKSFEWFQKERLEPNKTILTPIKCKCGHECYLSVSKGHTIEVRERSHLHRCLDEKNKIMDYCGECYELLAPQFIDKTQYNSQTESQIIVNYASLNK